MTDPLERAGLGDAAAAARADWRADEEEWTQAAIERWQHGRTTRDVLRDSMHRGDVLALHLPHATFSGRLVAIGDDVVTVDASDGRVDLRLASNVPLVVRVVERARSGGTRGDASFTFRARLLELEMEECDALLGTWFGDSLLAGRVAVGRDHLVVRGPDGAESLIALDAVAWVRRGVTGR